DYQFKTVHNRFEIVDKDYNRLVKKNQRTTVQADVETKYDKKETVLVGGDRKITVKGNVNQIYKSNKDEKVTGNVTEKFASQTTDGGKSIKLTAGVINLN
ncbi:MAG: hypothetical protein U9R03_04410, partial [Candidatus Aerophobetes bacterium]|nr:hypothetical protein [Candidatus Aerophobetes bacterium]